MIHTIATVAASCPPLLQQPLAREDAEHLADALKAIAEPARLRLLSLIQAQPGHEACVCHLTEPLGLPPALTRSRRRRGCRGRGARLPPRLPRPRPDPASRPSRAAPRPRRRDAPRARVY